MIPKRDPALTFFILKRPSRKSISDLSIDFVKHTQRMCKLCSLHKSRPGTDGRVVFALSANMLRDGKQREQLLQLVTEGKNAGMQNVSLLHRFAGSGVSKMLSAKLHRHPIPQRPSVSGLRYKN